MKKILFLLTIGIVVLNHVSGQQIVIRGKYKGQQLVVKAQRGGAAGDVIESVQYAPLSKLEKDVSELKKDKKALEDKVEKLRKENERLKVGARAVDDNSEMKELQDSLKAVKQRLTSKEAEIRAISDDMESVRTQLLTCQNDLDKMPNILKLKNDTIRDLRLKVAGRGVNDNTLSVDANIGASYVRNELTKQEFWSHKFSSMQRLSLNYSLYFSEFSPLALKFGVGLGIYRSSASFGTLRDTILGLKDADGDTYDARMTYRDVSEKVVLQYLELPFVLHIGNSYNTGGVQAWIDAGFLFGLQVGSKFEGNGKYTSEGYYRAWNVTMSNVPALGFVSDADLYADDALPNVSKFVVWAIGAAGLHLPFSDSFGMDLGVNCSYTLMPVAKHEAVENRYLKGVCNTLSGDATRIFTVGGNVALTWKF